MRKNKLSLFKKLMIAICTLGMTVSFTSLYAQSQTSFSHKMPEATYQMPKTDSAEDMAANFRTPPSSVKTGVYWYWISSNISKEGVVKDLNAMKKAGINRAYIGDIGVDEVKRGKIKMLSNEWWEVVHQALKTASELDIEIGIFNSPGWSQSGGPWVNNERAMRYLVSSEVRVSGPKKFSEKLVQPKEEYQDVKVLAYPEPKDDLVVLNAEKVTADPESADASKLFDGDTATGMKLPAKKAVTILMSSDKPFTARSLTVNVLESPIVANCQLQANIDGEFKTISTFKISRYNSSIGVGFIPYAPVVASFPATTSREFKLIVNCDRENAGLSELVLSAAPRVASYSEKTLAKMHETPHPMWPEYQWQPQAVVDDAATLIDPAKVIDITDKLAADGTLTWDVPKGNWVILRMGMTPTGAKNAPAVPEATGYETDKMSVEHIRYHFDALMGEVFRRVPAEDRRSFKVVVQDSYEVGGQNFTDNFCEKFQKSFGYDPTPYLPAFFGHVVGSQSDSDRFLWDVRRFIADEVAYNYVGGLREICNENGLVTWLECYGHWGFPSEFLKYGGQSDEIAGEYWSEGDLGDIENRIASSCGHIYGKTKIWAESNTCAGNPFGRSPVNMKQRTDKFFSEGINNSLLHLYVQQPDEKVPGVNAWFGNEFNRHNTWFTQMDLFTTYLKRCNYMLQQGLNVADIAYFIGEDAPKMTGIVDPALPNGYQYDFMNAEVIEAAMSVQNGMITLPNGVQYRVLVLPKLDTMRPELLRKIAQLVNDGAVVLGPKPSRSPSLQNQPAADQEVKKIADELWGDVDGDKIKFRQVGQGMIANGLSLEELFDKLGWIPDCKLPEKAPLVFGHRQLADGEIYFVANQSDKKLENQVIEFRVTGKQPELWCPTTGCTRPLTGWKQQAETTTVSFDFVPQESFFVVFRNDTDTKEMTGKNFPECEELATLNGKWQVKFNTSEINRGPEEELTFDTLADWSESKDERVRYFSGTAFYKTEVTLNSIPEGKNILLSLGDVAEMAKVTINGQYAGGIWTYPYQLDVTPFVKQGKNEIEIEVVNTWVNRLIGDQNLPEKERKTWAPVMPWKKDSPLKKSGLLGPVVLKAFPVNM